MKFHSYLKHKISILGVNQGVELKSTETGVIPILFPIVFPKVSMTFEGQEDFISLCDWCSQKRSLKHSDLNLNVQNIQGSDPSITWWYQISSDVWHHIHHFQSACLVITHCETILCTKTPKTQHVLICTLVPHFVSRAFRMAGIVPDLLPHFHW